MNSAGPLEIDVRILNKAAAGAPKQGSEAYDVSKTAVKSPDWRTGGRPCAACARERNRAGDGGGRVHHVPARPGHIFAFEVRHPVCFFASRTLLKNPILPEHCADAIMWLASDKSARTTGNVIPVAAGLSEAFLR